MHWKCASPTPNKFWSQLSAEKLVAVVFWDLEGLFHLDYMPHKTIIWDAYASVFQNLQEAIKEIL
jgi:hypothetical protein